MGWFSNRSDIKTIADAKKKKDKRLGSVMDELKSIRGGQPKMKKPAKAMK